jgi:hypothetical protein
MGLGWWVWKFGVQSMLCTPNSINMAKFIDIYDANIDMVMMWHLCGAYVANFDPTWEHMFPCWGMHLLYVPTVKNACSHVFLGSHIGEHLFPCS